jgi:hypothetical protein
LRDNIFFEEQEDEEHHIATDDETQQVKNTPTIIEKLSRKQLDQQQQLRRSFQE